MMKKKSIVLTAILSTLILASCGKISAIESEQLAEVINKNVNFSEPLFELDSESAENYLYLNTNDYKSIIAYVGTKATTDTFAIVETSDSEGVEKSLREHIDSLKEDYQIYRKEEVDKLNNAIIESYKGTVVMIVTADVDNAKNVYNNYLKK